MIRGAARTSSARGSGADPSYSHREGARKSAGKLEIRMEYEQCAYLQDRGVCRGSGMHTWPLGSRQRSAKERSELDAMGQLFVVPEPKHSSADRVPYSSSSTKTIEVGALDRIRVAISKMSRRRRPSSLRSEYAEELDLQWFDWAPTWVRFQDGLGRPRI